MHGCPGALPQAKMKPRRWRWPPRPAAPIARRARARQPPPLALSARGVDIPGPLPLGYHQTAVGAGCTDLPCWSPESMYADAQTAIDTQFVQSVMATITCSAVVFSDSFELGLAEKELLAIIRTAYRKRRRRGFMGSLGQRPRRL
jgi:hypothetical protein